VLREILVPEREGITEDWVLPHNEELHCMHFWPDDTEVMVRLRRMRRNTWKRWHIYRVRQKNLTIF